MGYQPNRLHSLPFNRFTFGRGLLIILLCASVSAVVIVAGLASIAVLLVMKYL